MRAKISCLVLLVILLVTSIFISTMISCDDDDDDATPTPTPTIGPTATPQPIHFTEVTAEVGLSQASGFYAAIADVNNDGYPDLLLHEPMNEATGDVLNKQFLYLNVPGDNNGRKFVDFTQESGIRANRRGTDQGRHSSLAVFADVDNDGDPDMFSGMYFHRLENYTDLGDRNDLLLNDGSGHFSLAPDLVFFDAGLVNTSGATFLDYDLDGHVDLFIGNWFLDYHGGTNDVFSQDLLYRNNGDGSFTDVTNAVGLNLIQPTYGVAMADTNGDGYPDLFAGNYCRGKGYHWLNNGNGTFSEIGASSNFSEFIHCSWGAMPRDFDNDGDEDLFEVYVHGYNNKESSRILVNNNNVFTWEGAQEGRILGRADEDPTLHNGDHYGCWIDANNDGLPDFLITECGYSNDQLYFFQQSPDHILHACTAAVGLSVLNNGQPPHPAINFDYDLDGDEDLLIGYASTHCVALMRNDHGNSYNWLAFTLQGLGTQGKSNKSAVGAKVVVTIGNQVYNQTVYAGNGHFSPQTPYRLTFGIGQASKADSVTVHWPNTNHTTQTLTDVAANKHYVIVEQ
ncbi:CRTAC1 family protein [bacterium]|nr:CRTAC1 family protein [bacterium]